MMTNEEPVFTQGQIISRSSINPQIVTVYDGYHTVSAVDETGQARIRDWHRLYKQGGRYVLGARVAGGA